MFTEEFILGAIVCAALFLLGHVTRKLPIKVLSSLGLVYLALDWYSTSQDLFGMGMMFALAFSMVLIGRD